MNVRKRGLALLMCICMIFTLLPFSAFADATQKKPSKQPQIEVENWCTNKNIADDQSASLSSTPTYANTIASPTITFKNVTYIYWKTMVLPGNYKQDDGTGCNQSTKTPADGCYEATAFALDNGKMVYYAKGLTSPTVLKDSDQIVNYYKQYTLNVKDYGTVTASDWGRTTDPESDKFITVSYNIFDETGKKVGSSEQYYNKMPYNEQDSIKDIDIMLENGYELDHVTYLDEDGNLQTITSKDFNGLTIYRNINNNVNFYLKKISNFTLTYLWLNPPVTDEAGKTIVLPVDNTVYTAENNTAIVDKNYTEDMIGFDEEDNQYVFSGWFRDNEYKTAAPATIEMTGNTMLYGYWTRQYSVTYVYGSTAPEGATAPVDNNKYAQGAKVKQMTPDAYTDYTFSGWECNDEDVIVGADNTFTMPARDVVFTGTWEKIPTYNVTYTWGTLATDMGNISAPVDNVNHKANDTVTVQSPSAEAMEKAEELGYTFTGWKLGETPYNSGATFEMPEINVELVAQWTKLKEYKLTYVWTVNGEDDTSVLDGIATLPAEATYFEGTEVKVDTVYKNSSLGGTPVQDSEGYWYTFSGWYKDEALSQQAGATITMNNNVILHGSWTRLYHNYTIECYWIGEKDKLLTAPKPGVANVPAGEKFTLTDYPSIPGYMACLDQPYSTIEITNDGPNVIKLYYSMNITVTPDSKTETYDGTKYEIKTFTATAHIDGKDVDVTEDLGEEIIAYIGATNAGNYPVELFATSLMPQALDPEAEAPNSHLYVGQYIKNGYYYVEEIGKGSLTINRREVTITGNDKEVYYNGTEQTFDTGYTVDGLVKGHEIEKEGLTHTLTGKDIGINYKGKFSKTAEQIEFYTLGAGNDKVYINAENYTVKLDAGTLTIKSRPVTPPVIKHDLIITAGSKTGIAPVTSDEYTVEGLVNGDVVASVKITGSQNEPGESANVASDAVIKNSAGVDVTKNYNIKYVDGVLKAIEPLNKEDHFNYIIGIPDGTVKPLANITRAEVATIFFRLLTDEARDMYSVTTSSFSDVADGVWYTRAIATLANAGILKGDPAGTFRPADPITRAEMAAVIARFAKLDVNTKTFSDIEGHWAKNYIELAAGNGWINGTPEGEFQPDRNITRAETVAMINRVLDRQTENVSDLLPADQMTTWSDNMDTTQWYYKDMQEATNYHKCERVGDSIYEKWTEKLPEIDWASYQI